MSAVEELDQAYRAPERMSGSVPHVFSIASSPRRGWGGQILGAIVKGYGVRCPKRALRFATEAAEAYNDWLFFGLEERRRRAWLETDLRRLFRVLKARETEEEPLVRRVFERVTAGPDSAADEPILEAVAFARTLVAAGVLIGAADDSAHAALDRFAVGLGVLWEVGQSQVDEALFRSALRGAGMSFDGSGDTLTAATALARAALEQLPYTAQTEQLCALVDQARWVALVSGPAKKRRYGRCEPSLGLALAARRSGRAGSALACMFDELATPGLDRTLASSFELEIERLVDASSPAIHSALQFLRHQGGKRLRPALTLLSASAVGGDPARAVRAAAVVEWLHQSSLVLDDMLDEAPLRRGSETLHTATTAPFAALVVGFILRALGRAAQNEPHAVRSCLLDAAAALAEGERMELACCERGSVGRTEYMKIIEAKTARLFSCSAMVGALACEADAGSVRALAAFGKQAGIAFQIVDDTLDYAGGERDLGKLPGTDHTARKITLPVLLLAEHDRVDPRAVLDRPFAWVRDRMLTVGIADVCSGVARQHLALAKGKLGSLAQPAAILGFADRLVERRA